VFNADEKHFITVLIPNNTNMIYFLKITPSETYPCAQKCNEDKNNGECIVRYFFIYLQNKECDCADGFLDEDCSILAN
jgi:hypothetical protein